MKRLTILLISCFFLISMGFSQYKPMMQENAEWYVYHWFESSCNETFSVQGDSVVNNVVYKKFTADPYCGWNSQRVTLLREDSINKRVYRLLNDTTEAILYDFSLQPGDTVVIKINSIYQYTLYLDSITNYIQFYPDIDIPTNPRVFYFRKMGVYRPIWIEGIGSLSGPLTSEWPWGGGNLGEVLLCHYDHTGTKDYNDPGWQIAECQGANLDHIEESIFDQGLTIYPVPTDHYLKIQDNGNRKILKMEAIDCKGKTILMKDNLNVSETEINISHFSPGIYLLKVEYQNESIIIRRFIKN
jgi:hypothetical protein